MILDILTTLSNALTEAPHWALIAAFFWGVISVLFSPCHLASIPLVMSFVGAQSDCNARRAFWLSSLFALGILIIIAILGVITSSLGRMLGDVGPWIDWGAALIFILAGLLFLDWIRLPNFSNAVLKGVTSKGYSAALGLGMLFGTILGPCAFGFMMPVLALSLSVASQDFGFAISLMLLYGLGHSAPIMALGTSTAKIQKVLNALPNDQLLQRLKKGFGWLMIAIGIWWLFKVF
ncbi:cytochrome C biogenesis protein [Hydrogenovibrio sp. SC-1]|uniref:cytochrome c biogenesis CcdA family protein n=1 Tax=Hydrogenovibrio sp. SC-1 TaxID=2065820 RepID=UPI000C7A1FF0|nr:cytochrome c biogenesis protein CcdA [Hydrogenovibrio sp. SC-1]PLA75239.1 cytochrome C biogenesis protein [Hydrogenovibrio sp. SC-1]